MRFSYVVFASPATGGLTVPEGIHWLTAAVQEANKNRSRVSVLAGKTEVAVINILSMPTHGMMSQKLLHQVRSSVLMQSDMRGPTLLMYPLIPRSVYKAKRTMIASAATGASLTAAAGTSAECGGDDDSNDSEDEIESGVGFSTPPPPRSPSAGLRHMMEEAIQVDDVDDQEAAGDLTIVDYEYFWLDMSVPTVTGNVELAFKCFAYVTGPVLWEIRGMVRASHTKNKKGFRLCRWVRSHIAKWTEAWQEFHALSPLFRPSLQAAKTRGLPIDAYNRNEYSLSTQGILVWLSQLASGETFLRAERLMWHEIFKAFLDANLVPYSACREKLVVGMRTAAHLCCKYHGDPGAWCAHGVLLKDEMPAPEQNVVQTGCLVFGLTFLFRMRNFCPASVAALSDFCKWQAEQINGRIHQADSALGLKTDVMRRSRPNACGKRARIDEDFCFECSVSNSEEAKRHRQQPP